MYVDYENQFWIEARTIYRYEHVNNMPGWSDRREVAEQNASAFTTEETALFVCDAYGIPVGGMRNAQYAFLSKKGVMFPSQLLSQPFEDVEKAIDGREKIILFYEKFKKAITRKNDRNQFKHYFKKIWMSEEILKRQSMSDTFVKEKLEKLTKASRNQGSH